MGRKHLTVVLHAVLADSPADPFKEMYKGCFAASLLEGGGDVVASTLKVTPEMEAYITKFSLQTHIDACIAKKAKGSGPKSALKFMMSDASDFFTDLSKKLKANGGVPVDTSMRRTRRQRRPWRRAARRSAAACTSSMPRRWTSMEAQRPPTTSWTPSAFES